MVRARIGGLPPWCRPRSALVLAALALPALAWSGCAGGFAGTREPVVSPTGKEYEPGRPPEETRYSQTATLFLRAGEPARALERALAGIDDEPENPVHHFLAGVARARLGEWEAADSSFTAAERIYPAYELEVEPERQAAWADAFNRGSEAWAEGDREEAERLWRGAATMYRLRPEAHRNLAMLLSQDGRFDEAVRVYREMLGGLRRVPATRLLDSAEVEQRRRESEEAEARLAQILLRADRPGEAEPLLRRQLERDPENVRVRRTLALALAGQGRRDEATAIYDGLLSDPDVAAEDLFEVGVALFRADDPGRAAVAFRRLTELRPDSREAWFNYANALLASRDWEALLSIEERLLALDPLNENAALIVARAHLETGDERGALRLVERTDSVPVHVEGLVMRTVGAGTKLQGRVVGNAARQGGEVRLRFTFFTDRREVGSRAVVLSAPAAGERKAFTVSLDAPADSYRYEVDGPP